jgi:hypothetical protein
VQTQHPRQLDAKLDVWWPGASEELDENVANKVQEEVEALTERPIPVEDIEIWGSKQDWGDEDDALVSSSPPSEVSDRARAFSVAQGVEAEVEMALALAPDCVPGVRRMMVDVQPAVDEDDDGPEIVLRLDTEASSEEFVDGRRSFYAELRGRGYGRLCTLLGVTRA